MSPPADSPTDRAAAVKHLARRAGFARAAVARAEPLHPEAAALHTWVEQGRNGEMRWFTPDHIERSTDPDGVLPGARSVVSLAVPYWTGPRPSSTGRGQIARYAWGRDYHLAIGERLRLLAEQLCDAFGESHRWFVDAGPAVDRAWAVRSGLGWQGKNTNVFVSGLGSFVFLAEIITTLELEPDAARSQGGCGSCRLCMTACPTGALDAAYKLDSRRCISYLTIEHRGSIPADLRPLMGAWVFGCDICQDVCPPAVEPYLADGEDRRRWAASTREAVRGRPDQTLAPFGEHVLPGSDTSPLRSDVDLRWLLQLSHSEYVEVFRGTSVRRARVWMLRRNAAVALGNVGSEADIDALLVAMRGDEHPIVRGHAAWAIGHIAARCGLDAREMVGTVMSGEADEAVQLEMSAAIEAMTPRTP